MKLANLAEMQFKLAAAINMSTGGVPGAGGVLGTMPGPQPIGVRFGKSSTGKGNRCWEDSGLSHGSPVAIFSQRPLKLGTPAADHESHCWFTWQARFNLHQRWTKAGSSNWCPGMHAFVKLEGAVLVGGTSYKVSPASGDCHMAWAQEGAQADVEHLGRGFQFDEGLTS